MKPKQTVCAALAFLLMSSLTAVELVREGKPVAVIVIPAQPLPVETYAAKELQYHVEVATHAQLPIVSEEQDVPAGAHVYLGNCKALIHRKIDPSNLPGNGYVVDAAPNDLYIAGKDSRGDPLGLDTHEGTLFGVYDILESEMQVQWLWPGKLGEVIPAQKNLTLTPAAGEFKPLLWFKQWRSGSSAGEKIWLKRQRFGRSIQPSYGHSFGNYWPRFGTTHPEYFAMLPDGTRREDPTTEPGPEWLHMCVSEPGLVTQIISDWKAKGAKEFLNVCENDGWAGCACPTCLSWDEPDPENPVPFDKRLEACKKVFEGRDRRGLWMLQMGSLSDRFARFWKLVADDAVKINPNVKVVSYVYDNYRKPPVKAMLNQNVLCGVVPDESVFGYGKAESEMFRTDWSGWEKTGCTLFLRPNYTLQQPNFPAFYARTLGEDLKFAMAHGLKGTDFDSLTSKYATQGPSLYMLAHTLNHPNASVDATIEEFYSAFGPAKETVKEYFKLWESIYPQPSKADVAAALKSKRKYVAGTYGPFYIIADTVYTPQIMNTADSILKKAREQAAADAPSAAKIEWLAKGLKHAELVLAAQSAYERGIDSGDKTEFRAAYQALKDFRAENAEYDKVNFAGLSGTERTFEKNSK